MLIGWGGFNVVEGIVDHHLLGLHHVRDLPQHVPVYDWLFLMLGGVGPLAIGAMLIAQQTPSVDGSPITRRTS